MDAASGNVYSFAFINQLKQRRKYMGKCETNVLPVETYQTIIDLCQQMSISYSRKQYPKSAGSIEESKHSLQGSKEFAEIQNNELRSIQEDKNISNTISAAVNAIAGLNLDFDDLSPKPEKQNEFPNTDTDFKPISFAFRSKKTPIEKLSQNIRVCMNKVSPKNVTNQILQLIDYLQAATALDYGSPDTKEHVRLVLNIIIDVSVASKFYSETFIHVVLSVQNFKSPGSEIRPYAGLLQESLCDKFCQYITSFDHLSYVDPDDDYDMFCNIQKQNDKRRAETNFFSLLRASVTFLPLSTDDVAFLILDKIMRIVDADANDGEICSPGISMHHEVDELCENLSIILAIMLPAKHIFRKDISHNIISLAAMKAREKPNLSIRAIFAIQRTPIL